MKNKDSLKWQSFSIEITSNIVWHVAVFLKKELYGILFLRLLNVFFGVNSALPRSFRKFRKEIVKYIFCPEFSGTLNVLSSLNLRDPMVCWTKQSWLWHLLWKSVLGMSVDWNTLWEILAEWKESGTWSAEALAIILIFHLLVEQVIYPLLMSISCHVKRG